MMLGSDFGISNFTVGLYDLKKPYCEINGNTWVPTGSSYSKQKKIPVIQSYRKLCMQR